jgi:hypothetical protein
MRTNTQSSIAIERITEKAKLSKELSHCSLARFQMSRTTVPAIPVKQITNQTNPNQSGIQSKAKGHNGPKKSNQKTDNNRFFGIHGMGLTRKACENSAFTTKTHQINQPKHSV